jgi:hypothetical protein
VSFVLEDSTEHLAERGIDLAIVIMPCIETRTIILPLNSFSLGAQIGGPDYSEAARRQEQQLRDAFNRWSGSYSPDLREFAFLLRIDGQIHRYTGSGKFEARRKPDENEIGSKLRSAYLKNGGGKPIVMDTRSVWRRKSRPVSNR